MTLRTAGTYWQGPGIILKMSNPICLVKIGTACTIRQCDASRSSKQSAPIACALRLGHLNSVHHSIVRWVQVIKQRASLGSELWLDHQYSLRYSVVCCGQVIRTACTIRQCAGVGVKQLYYSSILIVETYRDMRCCMEGNCKV